MKYVLAILLFLLCGCSNQSPPFDRSAQTAELVIQKEGQDSKTTSFQEFSSLENLPELSYRDSLHGEERKYRGLSLEQLRTLGDAGESYRVVRFHCRDGYVSEVPTETLGRGRFILAFRDLGAAPDTFLPVEKMTYLKEKPAELEKRLASPDLSLEEKESLEKERDHLNTLAKDMRALKNQGPFYPIFIPDPELPEKERWNPPFCVSKVEFAKSKVDRSKASPQGLPDDHPVMRGNRQFEQRCAVCHSINGIGGAVGPELNRPLSVVEYWDREALRQLMKDPSQVRGNSKMPAFHLKDEEIDEILTYLDWMSQEKKILD
jgi:mono/diheme cytochrome c family protein